MRKDSASGQARSVTYNGLASRKSSVALGHPGLTPVSTIVNIKGRAHVKLNEARIRGLWQKLRLWVKILGVLHRRLQAITEAAMNDPASPFYSQAPGTDNLLDTIADQSPGLLFDPAQFKANRRRRMSQEVKRILTSPPEDRTPEEIHFAMTGLRDIPQLSVFPVRMQCSLVQHGFFQCYDSKRIILKQGHRAECYYFILYGNVIVAVKDEETGCARIAVELSRGEAFGELALVNGGTRNSSVLTKTYTELLSITERVYEAMFLTGGYKTLGDHDQHEFLCSLKFLQGWPLHKMMEKSSVHFLRFLYIQRNAVIVRDSNVSKWLIVVKSGSLRVLKKLERSPPTVSRRTGLHASPRALTTALESFVVPKWDQLRCQSGRGDHPRYGSDKGDHLRHLAGRGDHAFYLSGRGGHPSDLSGRGDHSRYRVHGDRAGFSARPAANLEGVVTDDEADETVESEEEFGEEEEENKERVGDHMEYPDPAKTRWDLRPQTSPDRHRHPAPSRGITRPRKAWSAKHPASGYVTSAVLSKKTKMKKRQCVDIEQRRVNNWEGSSNNTTEMFTEVTLAAAKRTLLDDIDAAYFAKTHVATAADRHPQFVIVHTLTKGDVFGLASLVFPDQPSMCLVSNGAECMLIDKQFYTDNCPLELSIRLPTLVSPYPSDRKLQEDLVNRVNWDLYKAVVKRQVFAQRPQRLATPPS